jgi:hypothetical protein
MQPPALPLAKGLGRFRAGLFVASLEAANSGALESFAEVHGELTEVKLAEVVNRF